MLDRNIYVGLTLLLHHLASLEQAATSSIIEIYKLADRPDARPPNRLALASSERVLVA